jgi:cell wall-associated NlpC family hydrolase
MKLPLWIACATLLAAACAQAAAATPPAILAKRAQAERVLAEISAIDEQVNTISEAYDGARLRLTALRARLRSERAAYLVARSQYAKAEQRAARLLVWLYNSSHTSSLDVILGASSLSDLLRLSDAENAISKESAVVAAQTAQARSTLQGRVEVLAASRAAAQGTVAELASRRNEIEHRLAERQTLLVSVEAQVARLVAQERARQALLAAQARARLAAQAAARAQALAAARAKAQAAAQARAQAAAAAAAAAAKQRAAAAAARATTEASPPAAASTTAATPTTTSPPLATSTAPAGAETPTGTTTTSTPPVAAGATTTAASATPTIPLVPSEPLPAGYPEAASIALQYLGVPYLWGGESTNGFDCSGLVSYVYAQLGVSLPHFAAAQYTYGVAVPQSELEPGDLVFFDNLGHVGIYIGDGEFVDAPHTGSFVRIDTLGEPWYASHYVGARRI